MCKPLRLLSSTPSALLAAAVGVISGVLVAIGVGVLVAGASVAASVSVGFTSPPLHPVTATIAALHSNISLDNLLNLDKLTSPS
jgi:hypothetical protein